MRDVSGLYIVYDMPDVPRCRWHASEVGRVEQHAGSLVVARTVRQVAPSSLSSLHLQFVSSSLVNASSTKGHEHR
jgi:hypothetical protein